MVSCGRAGSSSCSLARRRLADGRLVAARDYATLAPMRHLRALMARGMTYDTAWVGQMESETPTGHATIATGVYPRKHSVVGFGWRDPVSGGFIFAPTDLRQVRDGMLTRIMEQSGVPTLSDVIHAQDRSAITVSLSGEKYYAAATMGAGADYILYGKMGKRGFGPVVISQNLPPPSSHYSSVSEDDSSFDLQDKFATSLAVQFVRTVRPRALFLNLPGADEAGHYYGGMRSPQDMAPIIRGDDAAIGRVVQAYRQLGLLDKTIFVVTADHGMAGNRHIVPIHPMYQTVAHVPGVLTLDEEFRISVGSIWLRNPDHAAAVAAAVTQQRFPGVEGALYKVNSPSGLKFVADPSTAAALSPAVLHAYLDLADTEASPAGPDVLLPYGEDTMGLVLTHRKHWGTHGGFSWGVQHIPLVIAGPGARHGVSHFPAKLVDIAPTIERLMGLPVPSGVDGVVLADSVARSAAAERTAQRAVQAGRLANVHALEAHSAAQARH
jgi:arylsulfatase A-like enzyme